MATETEKSRRLQKELSDRAAFSQQQANMQPGEHLKRLHTKEAETYTIAERMVERYFPTC